MQDETRRQPVSAGLLVGRLGAPDRCKCNSCGEEARGLCTFPRVYNTCEHPTCGRCGTVEGEEIRCAEHKGKEITAADQYDLSLDDLRPLAG